MDSGFAYFCARWEVECIMPPAPWFHKRGKCVYNRLQRVRQSNGKVCLPSGTGGMQELTSLISRGRTGLVTSRLWTRMAHVPGHSDSFAAGKLLPLTVKCDDHHALSSHLCFPAGCMLCYCCGASHLHSYIQPWSHCMELVKIKQIPPSTGMSTWALSLCNSFVRAEN